MWYYKWDSATPSVHVIVIIIAVISPFLDLKNDKVSEEMIRGLLHEIIFNF